MYTDVCGARVQISGAGRGGAGYLRTAQHSTDGSESRLRLIADSGTRSSSSSSSSFFLFLLRISWWGISHECAVEKGNWRRRSVTLREREGKERCRYGTNSASQEWPWTDASQGRACLLPADMSLLNACVVVLYVCTKQYYSTVHTRTRSLSEKLEESLLGAVVKHAF